MRLSVYLSAPDRSQKPEKSEHLATLKTNSKDRSILPGDFVSEARLKPLLLLLCAEQGDTTAQLLLTLSPFFYAVAAMLALTALMHVYLAFAAPSLEEDDPTAGAV
jgi:hypothetical protein